MIIADTGFFYASFDPKDSYNIDAKQALNTGQRLITTYPVMTETCHMLRTRVGFQAQVDFLKTACDNAFDVFPLEPHHLVRIVALMEQYSDSKMDMADASLVVLAEFLGHGRILTVDFKDFYKYLWLGKPFELLIPEKPKRY